jgi:predicted nucleic acid-binding protein
MNILVIDANILISALIKEGLTREILTNLRINFICPENALKSIYSYKEDIIRKAEIDEKTFNIILLRLLKYVNLIPLDIINAFREEADKIMGKIHKEDTIFIATALAFNCPIWSNDNHFQKQNKIKVFATKDMMKLLK